MAKLVRDRIPEIIRADSLEPLIEYAPESQRLPLLIEKLKEEVEEYKENPSDDELADIHEVFLAIAGAIGELGQRKNHNLEIVSQYRKEKREQRGGFDNLIIWYGNANTSG